MKIISRAQAEKNWASYREKRVQRARQKHENRVRGLDLVLRLDDGRKLEFRGRHYGVPPVPWPVALRVSAALDRFQALQSKQIAKLSAEEKADTLAEFTALFREIARIFKKAAFPEGRIRRLLWPLAPSPINNAPPSEVVKALAFFSVCQTQDGQLSQEKDATLRSSSTPRSATSSQRSPRGARTASPAPGSTSSWAS